MILRYRSYFCSAFFILFLLYGFCFLLLIIVILFIKKIKPKISHSFCRSWVGKSHSLSCWTIGTEKRKRSGLKYLNKCLYKDFTVKTWSLNSSLYLKVLNNYKQHIIILNFTGPNILLTFNNLKEWFLIVIIFNLL